MISINLLAVVSFKKRRSRQKNTPIPVCSVYVTKSWTKWKRPSKKRFSQMNRECLLQWKSFTKLVWTCVSFRCYVIFAYILIALYVSTRNPHKSTYLSLLLFIQQMPLTKYLWLSLAVGTIESNGLVPLWDIISQLGGWPVLAGDTWAEDKFNWHEINCRLQKLGFRPKYIFQTFVKNDIYNATRNLFYVRSVLFYN